MAERSSTLTRKGQITIPAEFRRALHLREGDRVSLTLEDNEVRVSRRESVIDRTAGIFKAEGPPLSAEALRQRAEEVVAEDVVERMR